MSSVIQPKGILKTESQKLKYKTAIKQEIQSSIKDVTSKKHDNQFLIYVLSLAFEVINSKKIDVIALVEEIVLELIPHGSDDLAILKKNISFIMDNNLIQKVGMIERLIFNAKSWISKKLL